MSNTAKLTQRDLKVFFKKTKKNLQNVGKEAGVWIKKGEVEISRLSKMGRLELDVVNLGMKREKLLKDIGKRVVERGIGRESGDTTLKNMCDRVTSLAKESRRKKAEVSKIGKGLFKGGRSKGRK